MRLSVCVEAVFNGVDFFEGMKKTKECGFDAIEFWAWWNKDIRRIDEWRKTLDLSIAALCTKFISLADPALREEYRAALRETLAVAASLGCSTIISQVGNELAQQPRQAQHDSIVQGLASCVPMLEDACVTLVFEPLNTLVDHAGYYLWSSQEAFEIEREIGSRNVKVLFDIYHQQIMEGNLISNLAANIDRIGHFHCAGNPGRHELSVGELDYANIFRAIDKTAYRGYVGLEYFPLEDPSEGLRRLIKS